MMSLHDSSNISNTTGDDYSYGSDDRETLPWYIEYLINSFIFIIISLNIPSLVVLLFTKVRETNFVSVHILSLSLTDCGVGLSLVLTISIRIFNYWDCWARMLIGITVLLSSAAQVATICLDRVLLFHNSKWISATKNFFLLVKIVLLTFLTTFVITVIPLLILATPRDILMCNFDNLFGEEKNVLFLVLGTYFSFLELFVILCISSIIRFLWSRKRSKQRINPHPTNQHQINRMDKETRAMVTLCIIVILFITLSTPLNVLLLVYGITGETPQRQIFVPCIGLACLNSAVNPIVYSFRIPEMREAFKALWHKMRCR